MSPQLPKVSIVIPIYREAGFLERALFDLVAGLERHELCYEILLIEQFSDQQTVDESRTVASRFPHVKYVLLPEPDFGQAMRHGMLGATGDLIVNFDIDYWDVTFVRMCLATMLEFDIDLVIGSKNARLSVDNRALGRRLISQVFRLVLQTAFGLRVSDTHGIKAWRRSPVLLEQIESCRFTRDIFDTELVIRGERAGLRLLELPVTVAEQRQPRSSIFARVPGAAWNLLKLYFILWREASKRSVPLGAITARPSDE
jgi:glycosyltransferase involved in cell wall biosynthesis